MGRAAVGSGSLGGCAAGAFGLPIPRQQAVELMGFDVTGDDPLEHVLQVLEGIETIHFGALDQRREDGPGPGAGVRAGEQGVLPGGRHDPMQTLDGVGIQLDPAVGQEDAQPIPVAQNLFADGACQPVLTRMLL